jgi:hypothetical protein
MRELARYSPTRTQRSVTIQLDREITLLALLAAVETCLQTNEIADVSVKLDDKTYLLAPSR